MKSPAIASTVLVLVFAAASGSTAYGDDAGNGFATDVIYVLQKNPDSAVRKLNENQLDTPVPVHRPGQNPADPVYNMDLGHFGSINSNGLGQNSYPDTVCSHRGQDWSTEGGKSICFTSSPTPSNSKLPPEHTCAENPNTPYTDCATAGARFFGVYEVHEQGEDTGFYLSEGRQGFQVVELDSGGRRIRCMQFGLAANIYNDNHFKYNPGDPDEEELHKNTCRDSLIAPHWFAPPDDGGLADEWRNTRFNIYAVHAGTIRYNPAKNTLAVAAVVAEFGMGEQTLGTVQFHPTEYLMGRDPDTPANPKFRVYEFELPDWPIRYYQAGDTYWTEGAEFGTVQQVPIPSSWYGEPVPVADPNLVRLVQIYELPGNIQAANGMNRNEFLRPMIDFDNDGNMYCTGFWYSAKHEPCFGTYSGEPRWLGECVDDFRGDVLRVNTLGHRAGRNIYHVPVPEPDTPNDADLVVERVAEEALGHVHYWAPTGMAVRRDKNELVVMCRNGCDCMFGHIYDLNQTVGGSGPYKNRLALKQVLKGNVARPDHTCINCETPDPECPWVYYFETPGKGGYHTQNDDYDGRLLMTSHKGDCGGVQNFMVLQDPTPTYPFQVIGDVGWRLYVTDPDGFPPDNPNLHGTWDAASPIPASTTGGYTGACCPANPEDGCTTKTQVDCYNSGGLWLGKDTVCGLYPCPGQGACCGPCGRTCDVTYRAECPETQWNVTWHEGEACAGNPCAMTSPQPMDSDCDGDVDQADFAAFQVCLNPGVEPPASCKSFDKAGDPDIGDADLTVFAACASGPGIAGNPACVGSP